MKKILITGADGQLGKALLLAAPAEMHALAANRSVLDITDQQSVFEYVASNNPSGIINAAAYTAVDKAEIEPALARQVNVDGPSNLAKVAKEFGIPLLHVSTDFVFDGKQGAPYQTNDETSPLSVYGKTKCLGEQAVQNVPLLDAAIVRTAWVYDTEGGNFLTSMLRLMKERDSLGIVADQIGTPTYVGGLARACWQLLGKSGIFHWTDAGVASWYDFAVAIQEEAVIAGLLEKPTVLNPLVSAQYPTPAARPSNSVLDKSDTWAVLEERPVHWRQQLRIALAKSVDM